MQPTVRDVDAALETMRSEDPKAAQSAESAVQWLTAGEGFDGVTQYHLQYFLWYTLPKSFWCLSKLNSKWPKPSGGYWSWPAFRGTRRSADPKRRKNASRRGKRMRVSPPIGALRRAPAWSLRTPKSFPGAPISDCRRMPRATGPRPRWR